MEPDIPALLMRAATPIDQPRAIGKAFVSSKTSARGSVLDGLHQAGALKLLFPSRKDTLEAIVVNTAGGVTGGDRYELTATAGAGSQLMLTTQAAERGYRAQPGQTGHIRTCLRADAGSHLCWLPQETILYEDAAVDRKLTVELATDARFLMVEPILFGRRAMGEDVSNLAFQDSIDVRRDGTPLYQDGVAIRGSAARLLNRPAIANGARAIASVLCVSPNAQGQLHAVRAQLDESGGASLLAHDVLVVRLLAEDGFELRRSLLPVLDLLTDNALPLSWRL